MSMRRQLGGTVVGVCLTLGTVLCAAQNTPSNSPAPCTVAPQPDPCGSKPTGAPAKSNAEKFPFPGETAPSSGAPSLSGVPEAPASSDTQSPAAPAAKKAFPFPGEPTRPDVSGAGTSSSSSSGDDSQPMDPDPSPGNPAAGTPPLGDKGSEGAQSPPGRHLLHRVNPIATKLQTQDEREAEDLSVAHFYTQTGDLQGAYLRSQDAVKTAPDDPDAHFALAQIAQKLNKRDEAIAEYKACLKLDASDKEMKDSRKALEHLQP